MPDAERKYVMLRHAHARLVMLGIYHARSFVGVVTTTNPLCRAECESLHKDEQLAFRGFAGGRAVFKDL